MRVIHKIRLECDEYAWRKLTKAGSPNSMFACTDFHFKI